MSRLLISSYRGVKPENRLLWSARVFILSLVLGFACTFFLAKNGYERVLMAISWLAVTVTAYDIIATTDVRNEQD